MTKIYYERSLILTERISFNAKRVPHQLMNILYHDKV
nr:MAG TPA: translation initiation factor-like protein [Caudoviricetes sp.]